MIQESASVNPNLYGSLFPLLTFGSSSDFCTCLSRPSTEFLLALLDPSLLYSSCLASFVQAMDFTSLICSCTWVKSEDLSIVCCTSIAKLQVSNVSSGSQIFFDTVGPSKVNFVAKYSNLLQFNSQERFILFEKMAAASSFGCWLPLLC